MTGSMISLSVEWITDPNIWQNAYMRAYRPSMLQDYRYGQIYGSKNRLQAKWVIIKDKTDDIIGGCQFFEGSILGGLLHVLVVDMGPFFIKEAYSPQNFDQFYAWLDHTYPKRFGRARRILSGAILPLKMETYRQKNTLDYQTVFWDISAPIDKIERTLKKNWRGALNKARKHAVMTIKRHIIRPELDEFLMSYNKDRQSKTYRGAEPSFLASLAMQFDLQKDAYCFGCYIDDLCIAGILLLRHGSIATYQAGWTTKQGRTYNAHHVLLWEAMQQLKHQNVTTIDMGGLTPELNYGQAGLNQFKTGIKGEVVTYAGQYS